MKLQWSLRTLLIVMTLGGPLVAWSRQFSWVVARYLPGTEEIHCGHEVSSVSWTQAKREAQVVSALSSGFPLEDQRRLQLGTVCPAGGTLHPLSPVD